MGKYTLYLVIQPSCATFLAAHSSEFYPYIYESLNVSNYLNGGKQAIYFINDFT